MSVISSTTSSVLSWILFGTKVAGGLFLTLTVILYLNQSKLLYIPNPPGFPRHPKENPPGFTSPSDWTTKGHMVNSYTQDDEAIQHEEQFLKTSDGAVIHTWLLLQPNSKNVPTLIYFHGNAGNMGLRLKNAAKMFAIVKCNVLMMDYRGYGMSTGDPSETGLNEDAAVVLEYAAKHPRLKQSALIAFGRSLGGAVSLSLAERFPKLVKGLILENTFLSVGDMVDVLMPFLRLIKDFVLTNRWDNFVRIVDLKQHIMFISGDADQLVPPQHMKKLFELALKAVHKDFYSVSGGTHNDTWEVAGVNYYQRMKTFVDKVASDSGLFTNENSCDVKNNDSTASVGGKMADEEEYDFVSGEPNLLPTMGKNFVVK